jgi:epoxyqueuosine reductase
MPTPTSESGLIAALKARAEAEGFSDMGLARAVLPREVGYRLEQSIAEGYHAGMHWLEETARRRKSPDVMWREARTAVLFAMSYAPETNPMQRLERKDAGVVSVYALNRDYHDVVKAKLKRIASWLAAATGSEVKVFVDTAPLMEKPLGEQSGLGWQGKHTNLVSRTLGSWFFIGTILTSAELPVADAETDHCGSCTACLDICPTRAFPQPRVLDAGKCISYLTIEHKGHIDVTYRKPMGNRIYGCDDCLAACPWNKFAKVASEARLMAREDLWAPPLAQLLALDEPAFRAHFSGSPVKRTGRDRFIRNCLIAAGNSNDQQLVDHVVPLVSDTSPLVRAMAVWALTQLLEPAAFSALRASHAPTEPDAQVLQEWQAA